MFYVYCLLTIDHTTGTENGFFMNTQKSTIIQDGNNTSRLYTPLTNGSAPACLEFYYNMFNEDTLNIYLSTDQNNEYLIWSKATIDTQNKVFNFFIL